MEIGRFFSDPLILAHLKEKLDLSQIGERIKEASGKRHGLGRVKLGRLPALPPCLDRIGAFPEKPPASFGLAPGIG